MWIKEKKHGYMWIFDFLGKHYEKRGKWTGKNSNSRACASWRTRAKKSGVVRWSSEFQMRHQKGFGQILVHRVSQSIPTTNSQCV